jgi:hypothetical protein
MIFKLKQMNCLRIFVMTIFFCFDNLIFNSYTLSGTLVKKEKKTLILEKSMLENSTLNLIGRFNKFC